ncbi:MAG TPA: hypothetical protein VGK10_15440 [Prolixibacteraceae bacterium]
MPKPNTFSALNLLDTVIEFTGMTPDSKEWTFERQKENAPRLVRLEQIRTMMDTFASEMQADESYG